MSLKDEPYDFALAVRKLDAVDAARQGIATVEQQQLLAQVIHDLEVCMDTILNRVAHLRDLVTEEQAK